MAALRTFDIDYEANTFRMDGQPFRYVSGSLHYFRVPRELWRDRMRKSRPVAHIQLTFWIGYLESPKIKI